jgi:hypothetical protein
MTCIGWLENQLNKKLKQVADFSCEIQSCGTKFSGTDSSFSALSDEH